jgi:hypothetical protein
MRRDQRPHLVVSTNAVQAWQECEPQTVVVAPLTSLSARTGLRRRGGAALSVPVLRYHPAMIPPIGRRDPAPNSKTTAP